MSVPNLPVRETAGLLFVSGQVGVNVANGTAPKDIAGQTERTLLNLENILRKTGAELSDVVKTTVFLTDIADFDAMNAVYEQRFSVPRPAQSVVAVHELPRTAGDTPLLVEIEAVACKRGTRA
jgi:2-iminobutanoate/2-iminopropanoate deaminase